MLVGSPSKCIPINQRIKFLPARFRRNCGHYFVQAKTELEILNWFPQDTQLSHEGSDRRTQGP